MSSDIVERLRSKEQRLPAQGGGSIGIDATGKTTISSYYVTDDGMRLVNPDGPEAATEIETLRTKLEEARGALIQARNTMATCRDALSDGEPRRLEYADDRLRSGADAIDATLAKISGDAATSPGSP